MTEAMLLSCLCWDMHVAVPRGKDVQFRLQNKLSFTLHTFVFVTPHVVIRLVFNPIIARQALREKCIKPRQRDMVKFLKRQRTILALLCYTTSVLPLLARYAVKLFTLKKYFNRSVLNSQRHNFLWLQIFQHTLFPTGALVIWQTKICEHKHSCSNYWGEIPVQCNTNYIFIGTHLPNHCLFTRITGWFTVNVCLTINKNEYVMWTGLFSCLSAHCFGFYVAVLF